MLRLGGHSPPGSIRGISSWSVTSQIKLNKSGSEANQPDSSVTAGGWNSIFPLWCRQTSGLERPGPFCAFPSLDFPWLLSPLRVSVCVRVCVVRLTVTCQECILAQWLMGQTPAAWLGKKWWLTDHGWMNGEEEKYRCLKYLSLWSNWHYRHLILFKLSHSKQISNLPHRITRWRW